MKPLFTAMTCVCLLAIGACKYEQPNAAVPGAAVPAPAKIVLERTFLSKSIGSDGLGHDPATTFSSTDPIFLTVLLSGVGTGVVEGQLKQSEVDTNVIAAAKNQVSVQNQAASSFPLGADFSGLAPGHYYVSVVVNGVPSWGLPFTVE